MFKRIREFFYVFLLITIFSIVFTQTNAYAYQTYGGHGLTNGPYNAQYWNGVEPWSDTLGRSINTSREVDDAISRWNNTQNTKVWMQKTSVQANSILDFHTIYNSSETDLAAITTFWNGSTNVTPTVTSCKCINWYWAKIEVNNYFNHWTETSPYGGNPGYAYASAVGHEIGHSLGLDHNTSNSYTLMYPYMYDFFYQHGIYSPTNDEVLGVQAIYGPLN